MGLLVFNNVEPLFPIQGFCLVRVGSHAKLTFQVFPEVGHNESRGFDIPLALEPGFETFMVDILHRARALTRREEGILDFVIVI